MKRVPPPNRCRCNFLKNQYVFRNKSVLDRGEQAHFAPPHTLITITLLTRLTNLLSF